MSCWIDAPNREAALKWGHILLGDYFRARYSKSPRKERYIGAPVYEGEIVEDEDILNEAQTWNIPCCQDGEVPNWREPWRCTNIG